MGVLCSQLTALPPRLPRAARPQDLDTRGPQQMEVLYCKAHIAFQNMSGSEYFVKIAPYLRESGRAP